MEKIVLVLILKVQDGIEDCRASGGAVIDIMTERTRRMAYYRRHPQIVQQSSDLGRRFQMIPHDRVMKDHRIQLKDPWHDTRVIPIHTFFDQFLLEGVSQILSIRPLCDHLLKDGNGHPLDPHTLLHKESSCVPPPLDRCQIHPFQDHTRVVDPVSPQVLVYQFHVGWWILDPHVCERKALSLEVHPLLLFSCNPLIHFFLIMEFSVGLKD